VHEDIRGLHVTVQDVAGHQDLEASDDLREDLESFGLGQLAASLEELLQGAAVAELVNKVDVVRSAQDGDEANNVWMLELRKHRDLVVGELMQLGIYLELLILDRLDREFFFGKQVLSAIDLAERTEAYLLLDQIIFDNLAHRITINFIFYLYKP